MEIPISELTCLSKFNDFEIVYKGESYYFPSIILSAISPVVAEKVKNGDFRLELPAVDGQIKRLFSIISGEEIEVNESNSLFFFAVSSTLQINELREISQKILIEKCSKSEIVTLASLIYDTKTIPKELITLIAANIDFFIKVDEFMKISPSLAEMIFTSPNFTCKDNSSMFKYLIKRYPEDVKVFAHLIKIAGVKYLDPITLPLLLNAKNIDINEYKEAFIPIIFSGVNGSIQQSSTLPIIPISYEAGMEMTGLIKYFKERATLCSSVEIKATSEFSDKYQVKELLNDDPSMFFSSANGPIEDIVIHLKHGMLALTQYTLMSSEAGKNSICPISWVVSGSNDKIRWTTIDSHTEDKSLCFENKAVAFSPVTKVWKPYSYFKISQLESGGKKNNRFVLAGIELFGAYTPLK
jgi:hypothetical protein